MDTGRSVASTTGGGTGELTFSFMFFRTLFALGWMLLGYVLWSDAGKMLEETQRPGPREAKS